MTGATGPGAAHRAAGLDEPTREREERGEPGCARGHEAAEWRRPRDSHQQREKCGEPQSSRGEGKELGVHGEGEALGREVRALERLLFSTLCSPPPPSSYIERREPAGLSPAARIAPEKSTLRGTKEKWRCVREP
ncbi:hypothetical protein NDU88_002942 [Pleurodeles waltl]|uniref:Uncharacterized protein n=1 Tax=Pleurodeles waltl TaxID=8319 RepID=A0AAV7WS50_PLEWA|nr:hypothetical protein NDU88_002942 [Pleurodeles waltl]